MNHQRNGGGLLIRLAVVASACGCASHLHNPGDEAVSKKAQAQFTELLKAQQGVFEAMKTNLDAMSALEAQAYRDMAKQVGTLEARRVTGMTWAELRTELAGLEPRLSGNIATLRASIDRDLVSARARSDAALAGEQAADKELEHAKATVTNWNRRVAVLEKLIEITPTLTALSETKGFDGFKEKAKELVEGAKNTPVTYIDADGKPQKERLGDVFSSVLLEAGDTAEGVKKVFSSKAPGLVVTIAALAKDLAEAERARAHAHLSALNERRAVMLEAERTVEIARKLIKVASNSIKDEAIYPTDDDETTDDTIEKWFAGTARVTPVPDNDPLIKAVRAISHYVAVAGPMDGQIAEALRQDAYLRHAHSIEVSRLAAAQHQALVSRGLESLVIYHSGGIKPQEIAELAFSVANLAAFTVIAANTN